MNFNVCLSGISWFQKQTITFLLKQMGAKVLDAYTAQVTQLVTTKSGSHKFHVSSKYKIPIVNPKWVWDCFSSGTLVPMDNYEVKLFTGFMISCTSIPPDEKKRIQHAVLENGGEYCKGLNQKCTHLIAGDNRGLKYKHAIKWKVHVVNRRWIHDYIEKHGLAKESDYPFDPSDETSDFCFKKAKEKENVERVLEEGTMDMQETDEEVSSQPIVYEEEHDTLFDPFVIYLWDIKKSRKAYLRDIICALGGTRTPNYWPHWTNILMTNDPELAKSKFRIPSTCEVLVPEWLTECYEKKKIVDFSKYRTSQKTNVESRK